MDKNANPLDYIITCCEQGLVPAIFDINNAKDELKRLREEAKNSIVTKIAWARINDRGDLYDLRLNYNPYIDQTTIVPLYWNKNSYEKWANDHKPK